MGQSFSHADIEDSDQAKLMPRLIRLFSWRTAVLWIFPWPFRSFEIQLSQLIIGAFGPSRNGEINLCAGTFSQEPYILEYI